MTSRYQIIHSDNYFSFNEYSSSCLRINLHAGGAKLEIGRGSSSTSSWVWMTDSLSPYPPSPYHCFSYFGFTTTTSLDLLFPFIEQPLSISLFAIILFSFRSFQFFQHHFTLLLAFKFSSLSLYLHYSYHRFFFFSDFLPPIHFTSLCSCHSQFLWYSISLFSTLSSSFSFLNLLHHFIHFLSFTILGTLSVQKIQQMLALRYLSEAKIVLRDNNWFPARQGRSHQGQLPLCQHNSKQWNTRLNTM